MIFVCSLLYFIIYGYITNSETPGHKVIPVDLLAQLVEHRTGIYRRGLTRVSVSVSKRERVEISYYSYIVHKQEIRKAELSQGTEFYTRCQGKKSLTIDRYKSVRRVVP